MKTNLIRAYDIRYIHFGVHIEVWRMRFWNLHRHKQVHRKCKICDCVVWKWDAILLINAPCCRHKIRYTTQSYYPGTGSTSPGSILLMLSVWQGNNTYHFNAFGMARPGFEPTIFRLRGGRSYHYATAAVSSLYIYGTSPIKWIKTVAIESIEITFYLYHVTYYTCILTTS